MCFVFNWEQTATCATYSLTWLVFITEMKSVYSAVRTGSLNKAVCASSLEGWRYGYHQTNLLHVNNGVAFRTKYVAFITVRQSVIKSNLKPSDPFAISNLCKCPSIYLTPVSRNLWKPTGHVMHQQFNIQQLYVLPTLYLCVLYLSENKQRLVPLTA